MDLHGAPRAARRSGRQRLVGNGRFDVGDGALLQGMVKFMALALLLLLLSSLLLAMQVLKQLMNRGIFAPFRLLCRALGSLRGALLGMFQQVNNAGALRMSS